jgi:hypothetical protein
MDDLDHILAFDENCELLGAFRLWGILERILIGE